MVSSTGSGPTHVDLSWSYADSNPTPRFDIYVNGQLSQGQVAGTAKRIVFLSPSTTYSFRVRARAYPHQFSMYLTLEIVNSIEVYAVDAPGSRSAAATMTIDLRTP